MKRIYIDILLNCVMQNLKHLFIPSVMVILLWAIPNILTGQIITSADNIKIASKDSLMGRADLYINQFFYLRDSERALIKQVVNCYLDVVPSRLSYIDNQAIFNPEFSFEQRMRLFQSNQIVVSVFIREMQKRKIIVDSVMQVYGRLFSFYYCKTICKDILSEESTGKICECVQNNPPEVMLLTQNQEVYFENLLVKLKECSDTLKIKK